MKDVLLSNFKDTEEYQNFLKDNAGSGNLRIRASAALEAVPIVDLKVVVSTIIGNNNVIFFDGTTGASGMIEKLTLPAPINEDDLLVPKKTTYLVKYTYNNVEKTNQVNMYDGICVVQDIHVSPSGGIYGS